MIECKNIQKYYGKQIIINNSNFNIKTNKISFLMGENGAGKTTLIKCMMSMENFNGSFLFNGEHVDNVRENILVLWDDCPFYTNLTGLENLIIFSENKKNKKQIKEISSNFLSYDILRNKVNTYSYGQKKILGLILVEILKPKYLIMDEISNGLDYEMIKYVQKRIKKWSHHSTILLTGHQFSFYNKIVDDVFMFVDNEIHLSAEDFQNNHLNLEDIYAKKIS